MVFTAYIIRHYSQKNLQIMAFYAMVLNVDEIPTSIENLRGVDLKNVSIFRYLGAYINCHEPSTGDSEKNQRIQLACGKFAELSNLLQNCHINLRTRISFLNCFVRSRLTYACQNLCLTTNHRFRLDIQNRLDITYRTFLETNDSQWV